MRKIAQGFLAAVCCLVTLLSLFVSADEVPADACYQFSGTEFVCGEEEIDGVFVQSVPDASVCVLCMGERVIRAGDFLPAEDFSRLTLTPACDENVDAVISYQPIVAGSLRDTDVCTVQIKSTKNEAPTAQDGTLETYKNVANEGLLQAQDPEGDVLSFRIVNQPRRGSVELGDNGAFVYTPKKNKVGEDCFTFVAVDLAGNESEPATVRISILQPLDAEAFSDLAPTQQFLPMWLREQGLYSGMRMAERLCFQPDQPVTRGEFLVMTMRLAGIDPEIGLQGDVFSDQQSAPDWMQPYLSSALRRGVALGIKAESGLEFQPNEPVSAAEAAAMVARTFRLRGVKQVGSFELADVPVWAEASVAALQGAGVSLPCAAEETLTLQTAAQLLYAASHAQD